MNTSLTTTGTGYPSAQIEEFGRLALALVLSAGAHLLLAQLLPQWVRPYEGAPSAATFTLTVSLQQPMPRVRPKAPAPVQPPPKSGEPVDDATRGDQPPLSMLPPEVPRDILPDTPTHEVRPALPLLDYYYSSREVDEPAKAVGDALLVYPHEALQLRVSGEVKLRLFIDEFGSLVRSEVVSADPPGIFEEAALQALNGMRFSPARKGEQTVRSQRTVQITFDPDPPFLRNAQSTLTR
ncbi:MAG TPA: TonB family protein [Burkholderiales bacterium]|jgi:protein TonB|nr:TonB family protein [Burkholderiales bacterium]